MKIVTMTLEEFAGQRCDVEITRREDGSVYATFQSEPHYGYPSLELDEVQELLRRKKGMQ